MDRLVRLRLSGWKSIRDADIGFNRVNVLVGANGSGKSNLVSFFKLLNELVGGRLQNYVGMSGGAGSVLHFGPKRTPLLGAELEFETEAGLNRYDLQLAHAAADTLIFTDERLTFHRPGETQPFDRSLGAGHRESLLNLRADEGDPTARVIRRLVGRVRVFQFHDTSSPARIRQSCYIEDNRFLYPDGGNLAAMLYRYRQAEPIAYRRIVQTIRQVAPFFDDFVLEPSPLNRRSLLLNWQAAGEEFLFGPHHLSDGTLRVMALITLLLQPETDLPTVIVLDEPELGLHPYAINLLAALIGKASTHCQLVVATQSARLVDHFEPQDILVVEREDQASTFARLDPQRLCEWIEEYSLGELWEKNIFGGGPH